MEPDFIGHRPTGSRSTEQIVAVAQLALPEKVDPPGKQEIFRAMLARQYTSEWPTNSENAMSKSTKRHIWKMFQVVENHQMFTSRPMRLAPNL